MADITDVNRNYLELLMKNDPEYKAGLYEQTPPYGDFWDRPSGPLYDVNPTYEQLWGDNTLEFEEGELVPVPNVSPKGPLHDIDWALSEPIYSKLAYEDPDRMEKLAHQIEVYDDASASMFSEPYQTVSYAQWPEKSWDEMPTLEKGFARNVTSGNIPVRKNELSSMYTSGRTVGNPIEGLEGLEPNWIEMNKNLMDLVGTKPTSPRNEQLIDATKAGFGWERPVDINAYAADTLGHEFRHNILEMPGFEKVRNEVMGTNINRIYDVPPSGVNLHQTGEYGSAEQDMTEKDKEELFMRTLSLYNADSINNFKSRHDINYLNSILGSHISNNIYNPNRIYKSSRRPAFDYLNKMWPTAEKYFTEVDRQGRMGPINKAKLQIGMPENITHPSQIERPSVDSPRPGYEQSGGAPDRGRSRGRGETGQIAGGHHFSRGGLMDIPLPGRNRDI